MNKISVETIEPFGCTKQIMHNAVAYILLYNCISLIIVITVNRHIFINIFQTEHLLAAKFTMSKEKSFLVIGTSFFFK